MKKQVQKSRQSAHWFPAVPAFLLAVCMLLVVPLYTHDAFFDINRCKVGLVRVAVPPLLLLAGLAFFLDQRPLSRLRCIRAPLLSMGAFLAACVISCALAGFSPIVLYGKEGRELGLIFMLCCCGAFFAIVLGTLNGTWTTALSLAAACLCALLGVVNALGFDPLGFYTRISPGQQVDFLSTIGNLDFFGGYLVLLFGLAGGAFIFSKKQTVRTLSGMACVLLAAGICASRADVSIAGLSLSCFALVLCASGSFGGLARAFFLWGICLLLLPIVRFFVIKSPYEPYYAGLSLFLCKKRIALYGGLFLLGLGLFFLYCKKKKIQPPARKKTAFVLLVLFFAALLLLAGVIVYYSVFHPEANLGAAESFLRFNDLWGSKRGFVYTRSLRTFEDFSLVEKLFGRGLGTAKRSLAPYMDDPEIIKAVGTFNDAHSQPLQMLLTCGLAGLTAFLGFYLSMLVVTAKEMGDDPILCGMFAVLFGYGLVMLFNVSQPILISTYFSVSALGLSRMLARRGGS